MCNNQWECPGGTDEIDGPQMSSNIFKCPGMFKCRNTSICIALESICDFVIDCHLNDDEQVCNETVCPSNCSCMLFSLSCNEVAIEKRVDFEKAAFYPPWWP